MGPILVEGVVRVGTGVCSGERPCVGACASVDFGVDVGVREGGGWDLTCGFVDVGKDGCACDTSGF